MPLFGGKTVPFDSSATVGRGSQFAARIGNERTLFELAYELEQAQPWADRWAPNSVA